MAVGTWQIYTRAKAAILSGLDNFGFAGGSTYVMTLLTTGYTPLINSDGFWSDISANQLPTAGGYTAGGVVLANQNLAIVGPPVNWYADDSSWASFSATFKYAVIVERIGGSIAPTDRLICYCDMNVGGGSVTGLGGTLTIQTNNTINIFTLT